MAGQGAGTRVRKATPETAVRTAAAVAEGGTGSGTVRQVGQAPSPDALGQRLRTSREQQRISLRALAKQINVSPSFLSQVELGRATPSVGTLYALVTALGLSLDDVMTGDEQEPEAPSAPGRTPTPAAASSPAVHAVPETAPEIEHPHSHAPAILTLGALDSASRPRSGELVQRAQGRRTIKMSGVIWERLTPDDDPLVDFLYVTYAPGSASCPDDDMMRHGGREYGHVISGGIEIQVGFETYRLGTGDTIHFDSATPHRLSNPFAEPCVAVWVVVGRRGEVGGGHGPLDQTSAE